MLVDSILKYVSCLKQQGKSIVFTNGCFDILHTGHIKLLKEAKRLGDYLIVAINTDDTIKQLKGANRPVNNENDRLEVLRSIKYVDLVFLFEESTPCSVIQQLKPHIHVKGGDYNPFDYKNMPEAKIVHSYGGEVKIVPIVKGHSTTSIIKKVNGAE